MRICPAVRFLILSFLFLGLSLAQSPNGTISGIVHDPTDRPIPDAEVIVVNDLTNIQYQTKTSDDGIYIVRDLPPGSYRIQVTKRGFKTLIKPGLILNVQNALSVSITLPLGAVSEVITVEAGAPLINTTDASVSTVVDRQFADNLPLNGRSFQSLIYLAPGVVVTPPTISDSGQFSVNGQRAASNYWMVDGVSANIGVGANSVNGNGFAGAVGSFSALGGTNSLVSVDALQEFRIQTSTYAPEFGRTPGGQISIVTRSGANRFHGTAFNYLRNDVFDANDWFANNKGLPRPEERQNDFGGTFSGPIRSNRTFFFFSYEGLRLRLPQTKLTEVPDAASRLQAIPAMQPYFNAFPKANGGEAGDGIAEFNASFSNRATLDAYSLRVDHKINNRLSLFGRYNYSPSELDQRGQAIFTLSNVVVNAITTQTATVGTSWNLLSTAVNDLRVNYSRTRANGYVYADSFGGASPLTSPPFPPGFNLRNANFFFALSPAYLFVGQTQENTQRQFNMVDNLALQRGSHSLKFGVDFRRLSPNDNPPLYLQDALASGIHSAAMGTDFIGLIISNNDFTLLFRNLGAFAQDTWRISPRLTMTYGLRWDVDFAPSTLRGPALLAVTGFDLNNPSKLALAPSGTPIFRTEYGNVAPRLGLAYELSQNQQWQRVIRGGFGIFYDLATSEVGNIAGQGYPFSAPALAFGVTFPFDAGTAAAPAITPSALSPGALWAVDPGLKAPYTLEWNAALEQGLGAQQTLSISYLGASGRRLLQTEYVTQPNANFAGAELVSAQASSNYNALQLQFQRRLSSGLQGLVSYGWAHSIDDASAGSVGNLGNAATSSRASSNRGDSDFDIRNSLSAAVTYEVPKVRIRGFGNKCLNGWGLQSVVQARSAIPLSLYYSKFRFLSNGAETNVRPDVVQGQALYFTGPQYPGGRALNPTAFVAPPLDPTTGLPIRQGDLSRNSLRGFGAVQWDFAIHRSFPIHESLKLEFRAEMFNMLNHPNFGPPVTDLSNTAQFGRSIQTLAQSLGGNGLGLGSFDPLYQIGGPRSMQMALKLIF